MSKLAGTILIIKDDFNNVLVLNKKVKKSEPETYCLVEQKARAKESAEKCVHRSVKDSLKSIVFDLEEINDYPVEGEEEEIVKAFVGTIKERIVLDKAYIDSKWVGKNQFNNYNLSELDKKVLNDFFNK